ncbi:triacylglycerol lipase 1-like [Aristolochia californica]|uniref:triacylglycerol lipase 1-like n=1 Tax=Aristolochia californica TaxID=171875 RepID=UPI0035D54879
MMLLSLAKSVTSLFCFFVFMKASATYLSGRSDGICETFVLGKGFFCTEFHVSTDDRFVLSLQRILAVNTTAGNGRIPVFLYHGIMQGGDVWVMNGAEESLGFILAEAGYDVWIGNSRSSDFSFGHLLYSPSQGEYWDWSFDDIVAYDLPAMLRFISGVTEKRILFVGFSQGSMAGFAALTENCLARLVEKAVMLCPVAYLSNIRSIVAKTAAFLFLDQLELVLGVTRFSLSHDIVSRIISMACLRTKSYCLNDLLTAIEGPSCCLNRSRASYYNKYEMQSTSMKNIVQMAQFVRSGKFCKYDRGFIRNLIHYWSFIPPSYKLHRLPEDLPFLLAYGGNDYLADTQDVMRLKSEIPRNVEIHFLPNYSHSDFVLGMQAQVDLYPRILSFFQG